MRDAVIIDAVRTPIGKRAGILADIHPADLSAHVLTELVNRTGVEAADVEDVLWGCVSQIGEQTYDVARTAVLAAGWPHSVTGVTVDRQCGSSQQAVHFAAAGLIAGHYDVAIAGGVESMSRVPMGSSTAQQQPYPPSFQQRYGVPHQGAGAEEVALAWHLSRTQLDEFALQSHARAAMSQDQGLFADEIAPVKGQAGTVDTDEGIRRGGTLDRIAQLPTPFRENGVISAGNASQISDGAAALLMMTSEKAHQLGLRPVARVHSVALAGADPVMMLTAPIPATQKVLARSGLRLSDIGVFEVNEAFAPVPLAWLAETGASPALTNPLGGAIALGHPLGGSGARLMTTMVHHMRHEGIRYGLQTMCEAGGQANATVLELL